MYFIVTNENNICDDIKIHEGLNIAPVDKFFFFENIFGIAKIYHFGTFIWPVEVVGTYEFDQPKKIVDNDTDPRYTANEIIVGERYSLMEEETYQKFNISYTLLHYAAKMENMHLLEQILVNGMNPNYDNGDVIIHCASHGKMESLKKLVTYGGNIHARNNYPFYVAASKGYMHIVHYLVADGVDVNGRFQTKSALIIAVSNGHLDITKYFLENGAIIEKDVLATALVLGYADIAQMLLDNGADYMESLNYALWYTVIFGRMDMVKYLVKNGADINNKYYPLITACRSNYFDIVKYLVDNGADVNYDNNYASALTGAVFKNNIEMVKYLLDKGTMFNGFDNNILECAIYNKNLDMIKLLFNYGISFTNITFCNALSSQNMDIIKFFVENGADIHMDNEYPLKYALETNNAEMVKYLVENGADVYNVDVDKVNSLLYKN